MAATRTDYRERASDRYVDESQPPARIPMTRRLTLLLTLAASMVAGTAHAQFNRSDPATGETYAVEIAYGWWRPAPTIQVASEGLGIPPTLIDFETDLGIESQRVRELRIVLRPGRKHKFKFDYLPISYDIVDHVLERTIVFNGQSYTVGLPVNVEADFTTLKIGYEYDFLYKDRGYLGFIVDTKITRARIDIESPLNAEFAEATAPIPTVGLAGRGYVARNVAFGGEFTFFQIPGGEDREFDGSYFDYDVYGTINFTNNVGVTGGWRKLDLDYTVDRDFGSLDLQGWYIQGVVRF